MPKEEPVIQEETPEETPQPKSKGPLLIGVMAAVVFVVGVGLFSVIMGVFSSSPTADLMAPPDSLPDATAGAEESAGDRLSELERLEQEIFGNKPSIKIDNFDGLLGLEDTRETDKSAEDSLAALSWIESEKAKLAAERADLDKKKKHIEAKEYQLKQLISRVNQLQSNRIGALAKLYDGMKASQVAPLINKLTDEQAVQVLLKMKPANAAKILGALSPERAATISANMITLNKEN